MPGKPSHLDQVLAALPDPAAEIRLHRLVHGTVDDVLQAMRSDDLSVDMDFSDDELRRRVDVYEGLIAELGAIASAGGYWGSPSGDDLWISALERMVTRPERSQQVGHDLSRYPAVMALYAAGVAASARRRYPTLRRLLMHPVEEARRLWAMCELVHPWAVLDLSFARRLPGLERSHTPLNDRLFAVIRPWLTLPVPDDGRYDRAFDEFEYLLGLACLDASEGSWGPPGRFALKHAGELDPRTRLASDVAARGPAAEILAAGLFGGSVERFTQLADRYATVLRGSMIRW